MWPMYVDYTDDECKKELRSLELEAYASVINAFRAQGSLSKERKKMLQELCSILSISIERHRAEIRRAVNDEHLNTIAERLAGPNTSTEWAIEGRRLVPLMPRLVPQTVFTAIANSVATAQAAKNATLPMPGKTGLRENGESEVVETMICRKRKEQPSDIIPSPSKFLALDNPFANSSCHFESPPTFLTETMQLLNESSISDCSTTSVSSSSQVIPPAEATQVTSASLNFGHTSTSPMKSPSKHTVAKPASTVTTFSSFDQLTSNVISSKALSSSHVATVGHEEQVSTSDAKFLSDIQNITRLSQTSSTAKSLPLTSTLNSTSSSPNTVDRYPISSSCTSSINKFLAQTKPKTSPHMKQTSPAGLGLKLNSQSSIGQSSVSPKLTGMKAKQDTTPTFIKKTASIITPQSSTSENSATVTSSLLSNDSLPMLKTPVPAASKSSITKAECSSTSNQSILQNPTTKVKTLSKTYQKPLHQASQFVARTLFSSAAKTGAKSLPPVIFNVSTTPCSSIQTSTKTTVTGQSEAAKVPCSVAAQLLPKSTSGIGSNQFKLNTSNAPTIQYRNEGGMVRSARIVNISQPVGSRLPCAISPSAISALGLSSSMTSTALRVTLPAGTLNTSSALRVSAAAKPNVIVVHKAQMWPRSQGAAVIMSSTGSLPRLSNEVMQETLALSQKQDKSRQCINKIPPRSIAPATSQSSASAPTSVKVSDVNSLAALSTKGLQSDSLIQPDSTSIKESAETICKRNLLADVMEASGIMVDGSLDKNSKKDVENKDSHKLKSIVESRNNKTSIDTNAVTTSTSVKPSVSTQGLDKLEPIQTASPSLSTPQSSEVEKKIPDVTQMLPFHIDPSKIQARKPCDIFTSRTQDLIHRSSPSSEPSETKQTSSETN